MRLSGIVVRPVRHGRSVLRVALLLTLFAASCSSADNTATETASGAAEVSVGSDPQPEATPAPEPTPIPTTAPFGEPTPVPEPTAIVLPEPTPEFGPTGRPSEAGEVNVLTALPSISRPVVFDGPNGKVIPVPYEFLNGTIDETYDWFTNPTFFGSELVVRVVQGAPGDDWAKVQIPTRPIMEGWVETEHFRWSKSDYYVQVDIGTNLVRVWKGDELIVDQVSVVTGDVNRETPLASTYIDEIIPGPSSAYGPWVVSLGLFSDAINTFGSQGALPKVALHGTNRPDLLGQYASNGCIRLPNDVISLIADEVPVGTRVDLINSTT